MVVIRYLAHVALMSMLVAGCDQSLFDANPGNGDDGGPPDARRSDGGIDPVDGGGNVEPDMDAGVQERCPEPCEADAVANFSEEQGKWRYAETLIEGGLPQFRDMEFDFWDTLIAWVGATTPPAITSCPYNMPGAPQCKGVEQKLLLGPTDNAPGAPQPALIWAAPRTGSYRLTADWRVADGATTGVPTSVQVARNSLLDSLYTTTFPTATSPRAFDFEVDAAPGDAIALTVIPGDATGVPLAMSFYVTDLERNDDCQLTVPFGNEQGPFDNFCGAPLAEVGATVSVPPPPGVPGGARMFSDESSVQYQGAPIDYSGDWTLQFWAAMDTDSRGEILSDFTCTMDGERFVSGGLAIRFDVDSMSIRAGDEFSNHNCLLDSGMGFTGLAEDADIDDTTRWHHYRIVRNKSAGTLTVCADGKYRDSQVLQIPSAATMATTRALDIGHARDVVNGSFEGKIADLRVYSRALPCTPR